MFGIDLKAFLEFVLPKQYCHIVMQGVVGFLMVNLLCSLPPKTLTSLLLTTVVIHNTQKAFGRLKETMHPFF